MIRLLKFIFIALISLILIAIASLVILITVVNPNHFKPTITAQVQKLTGRTLTIDGNLKWSFFPYLGIEVNNASLSNPKGFDADAFAKIKTMDFYVKLTPLFKKHVQISQILIKGANIHLMVKASGENNWQDLVKSDKTAQPQPTKESTVSDDFKISIDKLIINDATIRYADLQTKQHYTIEHFNLQLKDIKLDQAFPLMLNFAFNNNETMRTDIHLNSQIKLSQNNIALTHLQLDGKFQNKQQPAPVNMHVMANSDLNFATQVLKVSGLNLQIANLNAKGDIQGEKIFSATRTMNGNLMIPQFNLADFFKQFGQHYANPNAMASANTQIKLANDQFALNNLVLQLDSNQLTGNVNWHLTHKKAQINLSAKEIKIGELVNPMMNNSKFKLSGTGNLDTQLTATGTTADAFLKTLAGHLNFAIHDGALEGIDIKHQFDTAYAFIKKQAPPPDSGVNRTAFGSLTGSVNIMNGVARNNDLLLQASDMKLTGYGAVDLNTQQIDYQIKAILTAQNLDKKVQEIQQYIGGSLPIRITGTFQNFKVYPDVDAIAQEAAKSFINKNTEKLQEKVTEEVNKQIDKVGSELLKKNLQNLFH